jgi:NADH dehydrogenase
MSVRVVTVFGGTGFLGRRVVGHLRKHGFFVRIVSRHRDRSRELFGPDGSQFQSVEADIHDSQAIAEALAGAYGAVNAVSLYVERKGETFHSVHVQAAGRLAARAQQDQVERLVQVSGIGADATSPSLYIRKRGEGELSVRAAFPNAVIVRPAVMFGPNDAFLTTILALCHKLPVFPMFGRGLTRLQPVYVSDVAEAIAGVLAGPEKRAITFEYGGPRIYSYGDLLRAVVREAGLEVRLVPMPFAVWHALALVAQMLPNPPVTRNQIELMQLDNVASPDMPGFAELGISPRPLETTLREMLTTGGP